MTATPQPARPAADPRAPRARVRAGPPPPQHGAL